MRITNIRTLAVATTVAVVVSLAAAAVTTGGIAADDGSTATNRCDQPGPHDLPHGARSVDLDAAEFSTDIDNPYWPMSPGTRWVYSETDPRGGTGQRIEITVEHRTRMIAGIEARVVHDVVTERGEIVENTFDWYAQDLGGSIWYLGEFSREYEDGVPVNTEGSWEHGVDGAQAGVAIPAHPVAGCGYRQEYYEGEAEDRGRILTTRDDIKVRGQKYRNVLTTSDRVPLEPFVLEHKFYAAGVGPVQAVEVSPGAAREVLVSAHIPPA